MTYLTSSLCDGDCLPHAVFIFIFFSILDVIEGMLLSCVLDFCLYKCGYVSTCKLPVHKIEHNTTTGLC